MEERLWKVQEKKNKKTKSKFCSKVMILLFVLLAIFTINTIRKYFILKQYNDLYKECSNYSVNVYKYSGDSVSTLETYYKDNITLSKYKDNNQMIEYYENKLSNTSIIKNDKSKTAVIKDSEKAQIIKADIENTHIPLAKNDFWNNLYISACVKITTKECNGKICYLIEYPFTSTRFYIGKDDFLITREISSERYLNDNTTVSEVKDYFWEIGTVKNSQIEQPNLEGYEIINQ